MLLSGPHLANKPLAHLVYSLHRHHSSSTAGCTNYIDSKLLIGILFDFDTLFVAKIPSSGFSGNVCMGNQQLVLLFLQQNVRAPRINQFGLVSRRGGY